MTFENDNNIIVYALEKIISYAGNIQVIFVAQCVWWIASIIGLQSGLIIHIDTLEDRVQDCNIYHLEISTMPRKVPDNEQST